VCPTSLQAACPAGPEGCARPGAQSSICPAPGWTKSEEDPMPYLAVKLIKGVFDDNQKQEMLTRLTETMVDIEGEARRPAPWVPTKGGGSGEGGLGGHAPRHLGHHRRGGERRVEHRRQGAHHAGRQGPAGELSAMTFRLELVTGR